MRTLILSLLLFFLKDATGQVSKEFEGTIKYFHRFEFKYPHVDTTEVKKGMGETSVFFYKNGNYKWVLGSETTEYFDSKTQTAYILQEGKDTLFYSAVNGYDDTLATFVIQDKYDLVAGHQCKVAETLSFTRNEPFFWTKRTLWFSPTVYIGSNRFSLYRTYGSNIVFREIECWPIKIRLESPLNAVLVMEAVEITPGSLNDKEVLLPEAKPLKKLSY